MRLLLGKELQKTKVLETPASKKAATISEASPAAALTLLPRP